MDLTKNRLLAIGPMSGTSMDGVNCALVESNGKGGGKGLSWQIGDGQMLARETGTTGVRQPCSGGKLYRL